MPSLLLDLAVLLVVAGYAARGWRSGIVAGGLGLVGIVLGLLAGLWAGPQVLGLLPSDVWPLLTRTLLVVLVTLAFVAVGEALLGGLGRRFARLRNRPVEVGDSLLGAAGAAVVSALAVALLAAAVKPIAPTSWARTIDGSATLPALGRVMPDAVARQATRISGLLDAAGFPRVFSGLTPEPDLPAPVPDDAAAATPGVTEAASGIVKVTAPIPACRPFAASSGSGWVSAPERVITNAHVVAGASEVTIQVGGTGRSWPATVVAFDPALDLAALSVPGLPAAPLERADALAASDDVVVAGFPGGGPYTVTAGRVRGVLAAPGDDIYGRAGVTREVYSVRASVHQGNSGGPLLTPEGAVAGTVFGRSLADTQTAYALTGAQQAAFVDAAVSDTTASGTGECRA